MAQDPRRTRIVPVALGVGMLAVIVAAGLSPDTGAVPAQSNCEYSQCVAGTGLPWWVFAAIALLIVALLALALVLLRRRRPPPASGVKPWEEESGPTAGAKGAIPPPGAVPAYLETPEDVGAAPPPVTPPPMPAAPVAAAAVGVAAGAGAGAAAASDEPDIDSLMAELDKISGEILKRPKNAGEKKAPEEDSSQ